MIEQFHFLRPEWLLALPLALLAVLLLAKRKRSRQHWQKVVDAALLPHLLVEQPRRKSLPPLILLSLAGVLVILALAGPSWEKLPQPALKKHSGLVIALQLSRTMDAIDVLPSRLQRARFKLADMLRQRREGQTGLIVYAADAYTVAPLSDDSETLLALLPALSTDIMPADGNRSLAALDKATQLLASAGFAHGDILLIADSLDAAAIEQLPRLRQQGYRISMLAVGTAEGAPIPLDGGDFLKDQRGQVIAPRLDIETLFTAITRHGGIFSHLSTDDSDLIHLRPVIEVGLMQGETVATDMQADVWRELGPWLLLPVLPIAALVFRRGVLGLAWLLLLPLPQPAQAGFFSDLWISDNERAMQLFKSQQYNDAAELFDDPQWQASAYYRARQYELAIRRWQQFDSADAHYNRGNALTRQDEFIAAIKAYEQALAIDPQHEDAQYNKALLEKYLQQQQNEGGEDSRDPQQQEEDENRESEAASAGSPEQMQPRQPEQDEQQQREESQASQSPSNNNRQLDSEPEEIEDKSDSTPQKAGDKEPESSERKNRPQNSQPEQNQQDDKSMQQASEREQEQTPPRQNPEQDTDMAEQQPLSDQAIEQWLNRVDDDPGGLLRRKFKYLYKKQQQ